MPTDRSIQLGARRDFNTRQTSRWFPRGSFPAFRGPLMCMHLLWFENNVIHRKRRSTWHCSPQLLRHKARLTHSSFTDRLVQIWNIMIGWIEWIGSNPIRSDPFDPFDPSDPSIRTHDKTFLGDSILLPLQVMSDIWLWPGWNARPARTIRKTKKWPAIV